MLQASANGRARLWRALAKAFAKALDLSWEPVAFRADSSMGIEAKRSDFSLIFGSFGLWRLMHVSFTCEGTVHMPQIYESSSNA